MMDRFLQSLQRLFSLFRRAQLDRDLDTEMSSHLELAIEENLKRGFSPAEARRARFWTPSDVTDLDPHSRVVAQPAGLPRRGSRGEPVGVPRASNPHRCGHRLAVALVGRQRDVPRIGKFVHAACSVACSPGAHRAGPEAWADCPCRVRPAFVGSLKSLGAGTP